MGKNMSFRNHWVAALQHVSWPDHPTRVFLAVESGFWGAASQSWCEGHNVSQDPSVSQEDAPTHCYGKHVSPMCSLTEESRYILSPLCFLNYEMG